MTRDEAWLNLAVGVTNDGGIIGQMRNRLVSQCAHHNADARAAGYINAEHEALAFLASELYYAVMDGVLAYCEDVPWQRTPQEYGQDILDQRYGGWARMPSREEVAAAPVPLHRLGTQPHNGRHYAPLSHQVYARMLERGDETCSVLEILAEYDKMVLQDEIKRRLPAEYRNSHVRLSEDEIRHLRSGRGPGGPGSALSEN